LSSIIESCRPREGILQGTFNPEVFTASLSQVIAHYRGRGGRIDNLYTDADQFFGDGTAPTDGIKFVLRGALLRLSGDSLSPRHSATVLTEQPMTAGRHAWRMIRRRAVAAGIHAPIGNHTFRATGITTYLENGGALEHAQSMAAHESPRTTKLYDRTKDRLTQDEVERIRL
jgi:hypothetical protein